ncbi:2-hydroxyacid dehydrogenase [Aestuariibius sp. 2305UL40-4]|uniref:2-hydroxyacid dehydrogenase n=1 Tax=Aestuariibius violaceus TaxID=3234132 RepID=UPI00345E3C0C
MTKLLVTRALPERVFEGLPGSVDLTVREETEPLTATAAKAALQVYDAILPTLGDDFSAKAFEEGSRCKILANFGVGYNHIDAAAAEAAGVVVTNTPGAVTDATADIAMMLILMTCRRAGEGERLVRSGRWEGWHPTQMLGLHLGGKTLGIIGMGRIGQAVARRAVHGFGMDVVFYNRSQKGAGARMRQLGSLEEVLRVSDVVLLTVPATPETHHLIDAAALAEMKPGAHLVNVARGDVVAEAALIDALWEGRIAGAALDVYEHEPKVPAALREMENVVLLPHLGTATLEVREAMGLLAVKNLRAFWGGKAPPNAVNSVS